MLPIGGARSPTAAAAGQPMLHHAVLMPYFELGVRYSAALAANQSNGQLQVVAVYASSHCTHCTHQSNGQLQMFLEALCGEGGMRHPEAFVRSRSCYLMNRWAEYTHHLTVLTVLTVLTIHTILTSLITAILYVHRFITAILYVH
jgi:hypothetical protein